MNANPPRAVTMSTPPARRPFYAVDLPSVLVAAIFSFVLLALWATLEYRRQLAQLPEIGRMTPIEELRAAWAEADEAEARTRRPPVTMPKIRPRPVDTHPNMETGR